MRALFLLLFLTYLVIMNVDALAQASTTQVPGLEPGVSRDLAQWRAKHYSNVSYQFSIEISAGADYIQGKQVCNFTLDNPSSPVVLDWRPRALSKVWNLKVNNNKVDTINFVDEHIVIEQFLRKGKNQISFEFLSPISSSGSAVTRYKDLEDGSEYIYTLFVPSDASTAFPCFDQPDLKADFQLEITVPRDWKVITNTKELSSSSNANGSRKLSFAKSEKISTYLFAFATGPFVELKEESDPTKLFVRRSKAERASQEAPEVLRLNREAIKFFSSYFAYPFPFSKYDLVLIPEFAYRGMEHAGATFLRESSILFPSTPSNSDIAERAQLIFHETAHQWFGDLVTMKWFDDLWLKEGFANFMAAKATEAILPDHNAWNIFHTAKSDAYKTDVTKGTTPIWQELTNLSAAKSAYGNIVYKKAPAILRQAEFFFGTKIFQSSVQLFVKENAYANAEWYDLVSAIERRSGQKLGLWADAWVKRRSMPDLHTSYKTKQGVITDFLISQENTLGEGGIWPMRTRLILFYQNQSPKIVTLLLSRKQKRLTQLIGKPAPKFVFANYEDFGYGRFFLDEKSRQSVLTEIPNVKDLLLRALLWEALWDDVRQADLAPIQYIELGLKNLPSEDDEIVTQSILNRLQTAFNLYLSETQRKEITPNFEETLFSGMLRSAKVGTRITYFRTFIATASSEKARERLKKLLTGNITVPEVKLSSKDKYSIIASLLAQKDSEASRLLALQNETDRSDDARRYAFATVAAEANSQTKQRYFEAYTKDEKLAERWIEESLTAFNSIGHSGLTLPYLEQALKELPKIKRTRKIFFIGSWLSAFIGGQKEREALILVKKFLETENLDRDLRLKVLEAVDSLERCVKIREKFAQEAVTVVDSRR